MLLRLHTFLLTFGMTLLMEGLIAGVFRPAWLLRGDALSYRAFLLAGAIALLVTTIEVAVTLLGTKRLASAVASITELASQAGRRGQTGCKGPIQSARYR
jgi:hypothetical protein